jgi:hypothetical protein
MNKSSIPAIAGVLVVAVVVAAGGWWLFAPHDGVRPATTVPSSPAANPSWARLDEQAFFKLIDRDDIDGVTESLEADRTLATSSAGRSGETPLHRARSVEMARLLLEHGADAGARDTKYQARPVRWQVAEWRSDVAKLLEEKAGPDDDIVYEVATGATEKLAARLKADSSAANRDTGTDILGSRRSLLHVAAQYGQPKSIELLLDHGADIAAQGGFFDAQPLEVAAWAGYTDAVRLLIARGADVNAVVHSDSGDHTALWWAALTGRKEIVKLLLDAGATVDPDLLDKMRQTESKPYPGRALPPREDYNAVIEMLEKRAASKP